MQQALIKGGITFSGAQINRMVHLVIAALGAVAVETQGLVGHELLGARVDGSTDGNARQWLLAWIMVRMLDSQRRVTGEEKIEYMRRWIGRACDIRQKRTQERYLNVQNVLDIISIAFNVLIADLPRGISSGGHFLIMRRRWEMVWAICDLLVQCPLSNPLQ